jgi:haloalkane dehalogenase
LTTATATLSEQDKRQAPAWAAPLRDQYPFDSHFIEVEAGRMHFVDEGPAEAAPMLCVHGNPSWSFLFRRQLQGFAGEMRVIAPDHLGCGLSDQPKRWSYRLADHVQNLVHLIDHLDLWNVTLLVHDWGGAIGLGAAIQRPERIGRLVITNTAAFPSDQMPSRIGLCRVPGIGRLAVQGCNAFARAATFMAVERPMPRAVRRAFVKPYAHPRSARATWHFVDDIPMDASHPSWETLTAIATGLAVFQDRSNLILWGEKDWCFTPAFREEWERRLPGAECHPIPYAGHYLFEDAPEDIERHLRSFLKAEGVL